MATPLPRRPGPPRARFGGRLLGPVPGADAAPEAPAAWKPSFPHPTVLSFLNARRPFEVYPSLTASHSSGSIRTPFVPDAARRRNPPAVWFTPYLARPLHVIPHRQPKKKGQPMEGQKSDNYWSTYRASASALHADGTSPLKTVAALGEIEQAIRDAFPAAFAVTARADVSDVLVQFGSGQKPVAVRFSDETFRAYARCAEASRQQALKTLRLVCNFAFAREYAPSDDPDNPLVIDVGMALSNTLT